MRCQSIRSWLIVFLLLLADPVWGQEKKLDRFILSNSTMSESRAPLYMAKDLGLFEKYGMNAQIVNIRGAAINTAALLAGEIQMTAAASAVAITAAARGAPIVIVATVGPTEYVLVSRPAINSVQQLKGKTIGIAGFGAGDFFVLRRLLPKIGLSIDRDVSLLCTGFTSPYDRMNIMLAGKMDAVLSTKNAVARVESQGKNLTFSPAPKSRASMSQAAISSPPESFSARAPIKSKPCSKRSAMRSSWAGKTKSCFTARSENISKKTIHSCSTLITKATIFSAANHAAPGRWKEEWSWTSTT